MTRRTKISSRAVALGVAALSVPAALAAAVAPAQAEQSGPSWSADLSAVDGDDVGVAVRDGELTLGSAERAGQGYLLLGERSLDRPVDRISARAEADVPAGAAVEVDVRGKTSDRDWTEWTPAGEVLPASVTTVQVRVTLSATGAAPSVERVDLTADAAPRTRAAEVGAAAAPLTYRVFATREGLAGRTTANGHVIGNRDHFVALPSRRGLAPKNTGDYTVRLCRTDNSRCEYAPVWDVGPWNTMDDYWNPSATRQMWKDLPQGKPEAQAAYQDGYNGGKDEFGRRPANPAGIDLGDGTFWDGLKMSDNGWINVSYLWTGTGPTGVVNTSGSPLNLRAAPSTTAAIKGLAANKAKVIVECYVEGEEVTGPYGTSTIWDRIGPDHYVSDTYLLTGSDAPVAPKC
ncbi:hypothetical protein JOF41_002015 [Saccharothrix coeruleofusca]|uniref:hypothetical protein n=1 Tax=Saccharothrix coeruleofusca TaxID=33919 RepID=UPI0027DBDD13|nr:hypothetical protein [Saccharothrix coeruleofusca]MBP2335837.1 hypothetical protein [Saccharothrix coeruleofusca]